MDISKLINNFLSVLKKYFFIFPICLVLGIGSGILWSVLAGRDHVGRAALYMDDYSYQTGQYKEYIDTMKSDEMFDAVAYETAVYTQPDSMATSLSSNYLKSHFHLIVDESMIYVSFDGMTPDECHAYMESYINLSIEVSEHHFNIFKDPYVSSESNTVRNLIITCLSSVGLSIVIYGGLWFKESFL